MTELRERIAQLLIMGFSSSQFEGSEVAYWLDSAPLGGVLLFDVDLQQANQPKNIVTRMQTKELIHGLQQRALTNHPEFPLLIAVDYEGGAVDRLRPVSGDFHAPSAREFAQFSREKQQQVAAEMASQLSELGFNLNFAPVVDLHSNHANGIIGQLGRSYSAMPEQVSAMAQVFMDAFAVRQIVTCLKHFPGHGSAMGDTHKGFVDVTETFTAAELAPYRQLIPENSEGMMIMTAHVINRQLDASGLPATLSKPMLNDLLRHELHFTGVIISDDLQMSAISHHYSLDKALELTLNAGADMIIIGNQLGRNTPMEVIDLIEAQVKSGAIAKARIDEAFERVQRLKRFII